MDGFRTRSIRQAQEPDPVTGAIVTPMTLSTTYVQESPGVHKGYDYSRSGNPTRKAYEDCLANLESGKYGFAFASGCSALTTILHLLKSGDHLVTVDDVYGGTFRLFEKVIKNHGISTTFCDLTNPKKLLDVVKDNTRMIWIETPTNPQLKLVDIEQISKLKRKDIIFGVDNTFASPYFQRPLELGADISYNSTSKYISGHNDVIGGSVVVKDSGLAEKIGFLQNSIGAVPSVFDSYLCLRSLKTLAVRMKQHEQNALKVASFLESHPEVDRVIYPGLKSHKQHQLAKKQMHGFSGMISFFLKKNNAKSFLKKLKLFSLAESLGSVISLVDHPATMTHSSMPVDVREGLGVLDTLIRLSVGIEDSEDLLKDLDNALKM